MEAKQVSQDEALHMQAGRSRTDGSKTGVAGRSLAEAAGRSHARAEDEHSAGLALRTRVAASRELDALHVIHHAFEFSIGLARLLDSLLGVPQSFLVIHCLPLLLCQRQLRLFFDHIGCCGGQAHLHLVFFEICAVRCLLYKQ